MPNTQLMWDFRRSICILFNLGNKRISSYATHAIYATCQKDLQVNIQHFPKGITPKVNVIARLKFKLAYYYVTVQQFSHYDTGNCPLT